MRKTFITIVSLFLIGFSAIVPAQAEEGVLVPYKVTATIKVK